MFQNLFPGFHWSTPPAFRTFLCPTLFYTLLFQATSAPLRYSLWLNPKDLLWRSSNKNPSPRYYEYKRQVYMAIQEIWTMSEYMSYRWNKEKYALDKLTLNRWLSLFYPRRRQYYFLRRIHEKNFRKLQKLTYSVFLTLKNNSCKKNNLSTTPSKTVLPAPALAHSSFPSQTWILHYSGCQLVQLNSKPLGGIRDDSSRLNCDTYN